MNSPKTKYYSDQEQNAAFERCIDVLAELIEKYGNSVLEIIDADANVKEDQR